MPASITIRIAIMTARVRRVNFARGSRNAVTPLLTASTPVMAVQPFENALTRSHKLTVVCAGASGRGDGNAPPATVFQAPIPMTASRQTMRRARLIA